MASPSATTFEEVIAVWEEAVPCEWETPSGKPCRRPARWLGILHGCQQATLCTHHQNEYMRQYPRLDNGPRDCDLCGRTFPTYDAGFRAVPL